jgi:hypothetical protein
MNEHTKVSVSFGYRKFIFTLFSLPFYFMLINYLKYRLNLFSSPIVVGDPCPG